MSILVIRIPLLATGRLCRLANNMTSHIINLHSNVIFVVGVYNVHFIKTRKSSGIVS